MAAKSINVRPDETQRPAELGIQADEAQTATILERVKEEAGIRSWWLPDDVFADFARPVIDEGAATGGETTVPVDGGR